MRNLVTGLVGLLFVLISTTGFAQALAYPVGGVGQDISWPNCNNLNFTRASFGIVGVNGGLSLRSNYCIGEEASLYKSNLSLYVNTGYPGLPLALKFQNDPKQCATNDNVCLAYNYGYNAGKYAVNYSLSEGVVSNNWWLDVETVNSWDTNPMVNIASLSGEATAIRSSVEPNLIGYYTYPSEWGVLTNNWINGYPNWVATDSNYKAVAIKQCTGYGFNGGHTFLTQYIGKLDLDLACKS